MSAVKWVARWAAYPPCDFLKSHGTYGIKLSAHAHVTGITWVYNY